MRFIKYNNHTILKSLSSEHGEAKTLRQRLFSMRKLWRKLPKRQRKAVAQAKQNSVKFTE
jgi:hypothetical protein